MPRNVSELKSGGGDNSYGVPLTLKNGGGGGGRVPPSPTDRCPCSGVKQFMTYLLTYQALLCPASSCIGRHSRCVRDNENVIYLSAGNVCDEYTEWGQCIASCGEKGYEIRSRICLRMF